LRTTALSALITVDARISQTTYLPIWALSQSTPLENLSKACMESPSSMNIQNTVPRSTNRMQRHFWNTSAILRASSAESDGCVTFCKALSAWI
jgi:hypothetical protein